ncbi:MAG: hypothetical protein WAU28_01085 [Candidatus Moraniibacteriota bacterium]
MFKRLIFGIAFSFLLFPVFAFAEESALPASPSVADIEKLSPEIQAIFKKDPSTLTDEEKKKVFPFLRPGLPSIAQQSDPAPSLGQPSEKLPNTSNCFDDYKFGSVQADLSPLLAQTLPGITLPFIGKLKNENPYPLINGSVYVKIFKKAGDDSLVHQNGYPMVAFFEAGKDITLAAKSEEAFAFQWQVPGDLSGGDYEADFFFVTDQRFNLLGLSFTDDVTGNKSTFHITSENQNQVTFDKNAVTLNGNQYRFAAFPPHFSQDESVKAEIKLVNPSNDQKVVALKWQLFNWDGLRPQNRLDEQTELITLKPKETKTLSYDATKRTGSVSYLLVEALDGDASSIMNIRFVRDGIEEMRLNFPSITSFPVTEGKEMSIFSCVHSTNAPKIDGNEIFLSLTDADTHETIHSFTYKGVVTGEMMGVRENFTPKKSFGKVNLTTTLKHNGQMIDTVTQTYDCNDIDPAMCPKKEDSSQQLTNNRGNKTLWYALIATLSLIGLFAVIWKEVRRRKNQ